MTPEQITEGLYSWLMRASRIDGLPMGSRPATWNELVAQDPDRAACYRAGVNLFLGAIGATADDDEHLNFAGEVLAPPPLASDDDGGRPAAGEARRLMGQSRRRSRGFARSRTPAAPGRMT